MTIGDLNPLAHAHAEGVAEGAAAERAKWVAVVEGAMKTFAADDQFDGGADYALRALLTQLKEPTDG
jgi:hypothetical protein